MAIKRMEIASFDLEDLYGKTIQQIADAARPEFRRVGVPVSVNLPPVKGAKGYILLPMVVKGLRDGITVSVGVRLWKPRMAPTLYQVPVRLSIQFQVIVDGDKDSFYHVNWYISSTFEDAAKKWKEWLPKILTL